MTRVAYVNGDILPLDEATISIQDRGFLFGDGIYEVVRLIEDRYFRLTRHLERLQESAQALEMSDVPSIAKLEDVSEQLRVRSDSSDGQLYLQLTRGSGPRQASFPDESPTLVAYIDRVRRDVEHHRENGASIILVPEIRWGKCNIKSVNLLPKVLMSEQAERAGCYEAVFMSEENEIWEGTSTNVFIVEDGRLRTPDHPSRILPGITRREIVEIAASEDIPVEMSTVLVDDLYEADEVLLTGTLTEVLGVTEVDGESIGDGEVGPVSRRLQRRLEERMGE